MSLEQLQRLDARYRASQARLQAGASGTVRRLFGQLTVDDIVSRRETSALTRWLDQSTAVSLALRERAAVESQAYYDEVRRVSFPSAPKITHEKPTPPPVEQIRTSLFVTGVVGARKRLDPLLAESNQQVTRASTPSPSMLDQAFANRATEGGTPLRQRQQVILGQGQALDLRKAVDMSGAAAGAAAGRHVTEGGRDQIEQSAVADKRAVGYVRIITEKACFFCAALASRGPVYQDDSFDESDPRFTGPGEHKVHDHCTCSLRAVFRRGFVDTPPRTLELHNEWNSLKEELGHVPTLLEWRNHYDRMDAAA